MKKELPTEMISALNTIAASHQIETLKPRYSDDLDFHDIAVWEIRDMLEEAYAAGLAAKTNS